jgi:hypothetical protein
MFSTNTPLQYYFIDVHLFRGIAFISNNMFCDNRGSLGGAISIRNLSVTSHLFIVNNAFLDNVALQGGAILITGYDMLPLIKGNSKINNSASLFGHTFAGGPNKLILETIDSREPLNQRTQLYSGDVFPPFGVCVKDTFPQTIVPSEFKRDLLIAYADVSDAYEPNATATASVIAGYEQVMLQGQEAAIFDRLQLLGVPGNYTLKILPRINFDPLVINAQVNFSLKECASPKVSQFFLPVSHIPDALAVSCFLV